VIAIDANILVRYFVRDEPTQAASAKKFIDRELSEDDPGFVSAVTLVELDWVCQRVYKFAPREVHDAIRKLLEARQILVERAEVVELALANSSDELADSLIHFIGAAAGCERTVTFDRKLARLRGVELLKVTEA
jgi:predicted nucleic-acid-binding protein